MERCVVGARRSSSYENPMIVVSILYDDVLIFVGGQSLSSLSPFCCWIAMLLSHYHYHQTRVRGFKMYMSLLVVVIYICGA